MKDDNWARYGAAAGAVAIVLFAAAAAIIGDQPAFDASGAEFAAHLEEKRTRIQMAGALSAAMAPLFVWFLATIASLTRDAAPGARRAAAVAFGCGLTYLALYLADVTTLMVGALRPENMASAPELATALRDFEWLAMGMAAFLGAGVLAAFAVLILRDKALWPRWLGWWAAIAAVAYALRVGVLFTTGGPFAADGVLGLYVPVIAIASWLLVASTVLALSLRRA